MNKPNNNLDGFEVESFRLELTGFDQAFETEDPVAFLESQMIEQLEDPVRLLRWAVVDGDGAKVSCEGAYLKQRK